VLSGSPVAATALSFHDAGLLDTSQTFAMIAGSRLGAAFIVLVVGFVHLLRGRQRMLSLGAGLLSLLVTQRLTCSSSGTVILSRGWLATTKSRRTCRLLRALARPVIAAVKVGFSVVTLRYRLPATLGDLPLV
jgi:hypothetical protein